MNKKELFDSLVENGFDFLSMAITQIRNRPKYSVINFHAAVELLVKARLMYEHWSLIVSKNSEPDWDKFVKGDFQSITLDEAANKLQKIVQSGLLPNEVQAFREVGRQRNKMVHFFHKADTAAETEVLTQLIVKQQLRAWYYLHQLLEVRWQEVFQAWSLKINDINASLRELHEFLDVVFDNLKDKIDALKAEGYIFEDCPSCGFKAQQHEIYMDAIYKAECLVCGLGHNAIKVSCPECQTIVTFIGGNHAICTSCHANLGSDELGQALTDQGAAYFAAREGDLNWGVGNCGNCDGYQTVVQIKDSDDWLCTECFTEFFSMEMCQWCSEKNTADMDFSYVHGCNMCEGMVGHHGAD